MTVRGFVYTLIVLLIAVFTVANWSVITQPTALNLLVARIDAPLGVVMLLAILVVLAIGFLLLELQRLSWNRQQKALQRELDRQRQLAEDAEASRLAALQTLLTNEVASIRDRLDQILERMARPPTGRDPGT
jgi:uncharacterized integral membrane protein